ncbi:MAG TPA: YhdP family protein [Steroidobacteraceae bacterium]|nr:YhdP family protein [Steroidobacteraceae bacterium]
MRRALKMLLAAAAGCAALLLLLMLGLKIALDRAPHYQAQIKDWVYQRTGYRIGFAHVWPALRWYGPELYFERLELRSADGSLLARADGGRIAADLWQLLQNGKLFALRVELDAPTFALARRGNTQFALASEIGLGGERADYSRLALNDLPAGTLVIRHGVLVVQDWNAALPRLEVGDVNLEVTRLSGLFSLSLSARLPSRLGGRLSLSGTAVGSRRITDLKWHAQAAASGMSFPGWRELLPQYLTRLDAGTGAFQALVSGTGASIERVDLEFNARGVVARLTEGPNAMLEEVGGSLSLTHYADRWTLRGRRLRAARAGRSDPDSELDASWRENDSGMLALRAQANYLRAEALLPLVGLMPQKDIRERLRDLAPTGEWSDMRLTLARRALGEPWQFEAHARFRDVGFAPVGRAPGLRGLSGSLAGNEIAGHVTLDAQSAVYDWPDQLPEPIALPLLKANLYWRRTPQELLMATSDLKLRTRDADVRAKLAWAQPSDGSSPVFTLAASVDNGNAGDARLYFPHQLLQAGALQWLDRAFVSGHLSHGDAVFMGPVRRFPFRDGGGLFLIRFKVDHLTLDYRENWPRIENLTARAEFRNQGMSVEVTSALTAGLKIDGAEARFADFKTGEMQLHAAAHGDAAAALEYLAATPLDAMAGRGFSSVEASGALRCSVDLFFPFREFEQRRVLVHVDLDGATVKRRGSSLAATELSGGADIDGAQVVHADVRGRLLGGAFQMTARAPRSRPATRTQLDLRGTLSAEALRSAFSLPAKVAISGQTDWRAVLRMAPEPARERSLRLSSTLAGLELGLPEPLRKPAGASMPLSLDIQWPASNVTQLRIALASLLRSDVTLNWDSGSPKLARAAVSFGGGEPAYSDMQALNVSGDIGELDLGGWLKLTSGANAPMASYLRTASFTVDRIDYLGLSFLDVGLSLAADHGGWSIALDGPNVVGHVALPGPQDPSAPWDLDFERLKFADAPETDAPPAGEGGADRNSAFDPRTLPAIRFHAGELTWGDRQFGEVQATIVKVDNGVSLTALTASSPSYGAHLTGEWRGSSSDVKGTITSSDVGETLKQLGFDAVLEAKSGRVDFDLAWPGAPTADDLADAAGHVHVSLDKGQIRGVKPGAGRVLGLASFSELPRRLALDFSDVTDKGFAFDTVRGDFDLRDGSAYTDDVLVKGPAAEIGLIGRVGLKNKDYDQTAVVTGNVSSTLALPAFAAGPIVGGAVLLFTQVFKQPLKGLVRGYYRITGSWDNPTVERIKSADAGTAAAEAPKL